MIEQIRLSVTKTKYRLVKSNQKLNKPNHVKSEREVSIYSQF